MTFPKDTRVPSTTYDKQHQPEIKGTIKDTLEANPKFSIHYLMRCCLLTAGVASMGAYLSSGKHRKALLEEMSYSNNIPTLQLALSATPANKMRLYITAKLINKALKVNRPTSLDIITTLYYKGHRDMNTAIDSLIRAISTKKHTEVNKSNLLHTLDMIKASPNTWSQETYHSLCGTTHCIAGHAQLLSGKQANIPTTEHDANEYLGIDGRFLYQDNWSLRDIEHIIIAICFNEGPVPTYNIGALERDMQDSLNIAQTLTETTQSVRTREHHEDQKTNKPDVEGGNAAEQHKTNPPLTLGKHYLVSTRYPDEWNLAVYVGEITDNHGFRLKGSTTIQLCTTYKDIQE